MYLQLGIGATAIGMLIVLANLNNGEDRSFWGGWLSIVVGLLSLARWFLGMM